MINYVKIPHSEHFDKVSILVVYSIFIIFDITKMTLHSGSAVAKLSY
jgi:hypothetical protein